MKKAFLTLSVLLAAAVTLAAQGRVSTRKYIISDFSDKITKVVLTGSNVLDGSIRQEVVNSWTLSPFEFCTPAEFEKLKKSPDYYFLLSAAAQFKGEIAPSIVFLTLVKGGPEAAEGTAGMHEVISLPVCPSGLSSGRDLVYLGAIVKAIQTFTEAAMRSEKVAYLGSDWFNSTYAREGKMMKILLSSDDIDQSVKDAQKYLDEDFFIVSEDDVDKAFLTENFNTLCSYVVAPAGLNSGSWCYKMLFEAGSGRLFYITRHKLSARKGPGFLTSDLKRIERGR
ncbi:MAG: hypothetical protein J5835_07180 [Bacteroidales bacterium]|nr:hypothetical protein [Bacteroidales bacterium]